MIKSMPPPAAILDLSKLRSVNECADACPHCSYTAVNAAEKTGEAFGKFIAANPFEPDGRTAREIDAVVAELRKSHGAKSVGAQGFCWGGYHVIHAAQHADKVHDERLASGHPMTYSAQDAMRHRLTAVTASHVLWQPPSLWHIPGCRTSMTSNETAGPAF